MSIRHLISSLILRLTGASSVDAIMAGFNKTIRKLDNLMDHELAVADALDAKADALRLAAADAEAAAEAATERAFAANYKAAKLKELFG